jgi:hypothetical protein
MGFLHERSTPDLSYCMRHLIDMNTVLHVAIGGPRRSKVESSMR